MPTVPTEVSEQSFTGNGATVDFPLTIPILETSNLVVKLTPSGGVESVLVEGVHYSVDAAPSATPTVTMVTAPPAASTLLIQRTLPITQDVNLLTSGPFSPSTHTEMHDRRTMVDQQLARRLSALESAGAVGSVVAGDGLSFSGTTLHVGAGAGIQANADTVEVLLAVVGPSPVFVGGGISGVVDIAARQDHGHSVTTGAPADLAVGAVADTGAGGNIARASHVHGVPAGVPVNVTKAANAGGAATTFARSDHKHDVSTAAAIDLTDATNAEGGATTLARSNHTHAHGVRGGGTLHADVVSGGADGFMTGADKAILDALNATKSHVYAVRSVAQAIPHNALTTVIFDTEYRDSKGEYDPATGLFTAAQDGYYLIASGVHLDGAAADIANTNVCSMAKFGGSETMTVGGYWKNGVDSAEMVVTSSSVHFLSAGQTAYVQIYHFRSTGAARNTSAGALVWFTVDRIA